MVLPSFLSSSPRRLKKRSTSRADSRDGEGGGETAQDVIVRQLTEKRIAELDMLLGRIKEEYLYVMQVNACVTYVFTLWCGVIMPMRVCMLKCL